MDSFYEVLDILKKWETGGTRVTSYGALQICHVPHVGSEAWFHKVYAGLKNGEIKSIESDLKQELPEDLKAFFKEANGINVFSNSTYIYGLRKSYSRMGDDAVQPYHIVDSNNSLRTYKPKEWLAFGGYSFDGSTVFFDLSVSKTEVFRCERYSTKIVNRWDNLGNWLLSEVKRLSCLFDIDGKKYNKETPTIPGN